MRRKYNYIYVLMCIFFAKEQETPAGQCTLWRVSFSYAEKKIMRSVDYTVAKNVKTCRKDLVRLLKMDLESWKANGTFLPDISSYIIKTASLHMFEKYNENADWTTDKLNTRHYDALCFLLEIFRSKRCGIPTLEHYFLSEYNVLDHLKLLEDKGADQCNYICRKIEDLLAKDFRAYSHKK